MVNRPTKYVEAIEDSKDFNFFQGVALSLDIFSPLQKLLSDLGGFQIGFNINLNNTYFPTFETGMGICNHKDGNTLIKYKTSSPFFLIGIDYNILKNKVQHNNFFLGCRYGFSHFKFNISGSEIVDPIWKSSEPFDYKNISLTSHWIELLVGVRVKIFRNIHMGWSIRFKKNLYSSSNDYAEPYYIPGYGTTTNSSSWGGTYNILFDLNFKKKNVVVVN